MRRGFWFIAGAGAGVYAVNRVRRLRENFTLAGLHDRAEALRIGARMVRDEVAQASADREIELREQLGLPALTRPGLTGSSAEPTELSPPRTTRQRGTN